MPNSFYKNNYWTKDINQDIEIEEKINSFFVEKESIDNIFYQECAYCKKKINPLIVKGFQGEKLLTTPGSNEKDFAFYACCEKAFNDFPQHIINIIEETGVDHFKLPLLSSCLADRLLETLNKKSKNFLFFKNLSSVIPYINKKEENYLESRSLKNSLKKIYKNNFIINKLNNIPKNIQELHFQRWGKNRNNDFFDYLNYLVSANFCDAYSLEKNKITEAFIINIKTSNTYHFYYSIFNSNINGIGTSVLSLIYNDFIKNNKIDYFSFGRGAEKYKYRYANGFKLVFEIKGFYINDNKKNK